MSTTSSTLDNHSSFSSFVDTHQSIMIGGGVVLALVVGGLMLQSKTKKNLPATATSDTSGLDGGKVYVPSTTNFSNTTYQPFSGDPKLTTVTGSPVTIGSPTSTSTSTTTTATGGTTFIPGPHPIPLPVPKPPVATGKGLKWDQRHIIVGGETLSSIAASLTRTCRAAGMPGSMMITWHDLYGHNTDVINRAAQSHGHRTDYWNWIFPGENLVTPRWG
jgi:hypothetical protein